MGSAVNRWEQQRQRWEGASGQLAERSRPRLLRQLAAARSDDASGQVQCAPCDDDHVVLSHTLHQLPAGQSSA